MTTSAFTPNPATRLPSGRHGLTREAVVASQRSRLIDAMAQVVAERGYPATTVADVVERAGVSRRTFYEQFADKEACFLAAYDVGLTAGLEEMVRDCLRTRGTAALPGLGEPILRAVFAVFGADPPA